MLPSGNASGAARATNDSLARTTRFGRARLPALHRGFRRRANAHDSVQAALHANERERALPAPSIALKPSTWLAGRHAGGDDARTARERSVSLRPQEPPSLPSVEYPRPKGPLIRERGSRLLSYCGTKVNGNAPADHRNGDQADSDLDSQPEKGPCTPCELRRVRIHRNAERVVEAKQNSSSDPRRSDRFRQGLNPSYWLNDLSKEHGNGLVKRVR